MSNKSEDLRKQLNEVTEKRMALWTMADQMSQRELTADESATLSKCVEDLRNHDVRIEALEAELALEETKEEPVEAAISETQEDIADNHLRSKPSIVIPPKRPVSPMIVRDYGDRNFTRNRDLAIRGWFLNGAGKATDAHHKAARSIGVDLNNRSLTGFLYANPKEQRGTDPQSSVVAGLGKELVPTEMIATLEKKLTYLSPLRNYCKVYRTAGGGPLQIPVCNDTDEGVLVPENDLKPMGDIPFSQVTFGSYLYNSKIVRVSIQLLQDSAVNIPAELGDILGTRLGRAIGKAYINGTGTAQPQGLLTGATGTLTTAAAGSITVEDLLSLVGSLDRAYRGSDCAFVMNDATLLALRKIRATSGEPIFSTDYRTAGEPETLLGYKVIVDNNLPSATTTGSKAVIFGNLQYFAIRDVMEITLKRNDWSAWDHNQVCFMSELRTDSRCLLGDAIKVLAYK